MSIPSSFAPPSTNVKFDPCLYATGLWIAKMVLYVTRPPNCYSGDLEIVLLSYHVSNPLKYFLYALVVRALEFNFRSQIYRILSFRCSIIHGVVNCSFCCIFRMDFVGVQGWEQFNSWTRILANLNSNLGVFFLHLTKHCFSGSDIKNKEDFIICTRNMFPVNPYSVFISVDSEERVFLRRIEELGWMVFPRRTMF